MGVGILGVEHYNEIKNISICEFLPPHLVIYVDLAAEEVQKKLKASGKVSKRPALLSEQSFIWGRAVSSFKKDIQSML